MKWPSVTKSEPCRVCRKPDWCQRAPDGDLSKCMRVEQGSFVPSKGGGWLHGDSTTPREVFQRPMQQERAIGPRATPGVCDAAFAFLLSELTLSDDHVADLKRRGLDEEAVTRNGYATASDRERMRTIATEASKRVTLAGVPGFLWVREGRWTIEADPGDLLIPVRDRQSRILALVRRTIDPAAKYKWTSTKQSPSGAPIHHAEPWHVDLRPCLYLTEGALKADTIASVLNFSTIGLAGATSIPSGIGTILHDAYPDVRSAFIAFDADFRTNEAVLAGRTRLTQSLQAAGFVVRFVEWDAADAKGLDDLLVRARA